MKSKSESYMHNYAKITLTSWLRKKYNKGWNCLINLNDPTMKNKSDSKKWKILTEYPVCKSNNKKSLIGVDIMWNDWNNKSHKFVRKDGIPEYWELKKNGIDVLFIFDVVLIYDDVIISVFEVEHKNPSNDKKIKFLKKNNIKFYELSAFDILDNTHPPKNLTCLKFIN